MITFNHFLTIKGFDDYELPANVAAVYAGIDEAECFHSHGKQLKEIWQLRSQVIPRSL